MRTQEELQAIQHSLVDAVKSKNIPEVKRLIADTGINLNTNVSGFSASHYIGRFADDSLRVLLQAYSELDFNIHEYACGAAEAGHRAYAEQLRTQFGANVDWIASGAAWVGHKAYAEELRTQFGANVDWIASGAAWGGHKAYAEELRTQFGADVDEIASGAALGGHRSYAEQLRTQFGADVDLIAYGAALGGHRAYAEELRTEFGADMDCIAKGAARGGHTAYSEELRTQFGVSVDEIARGAALGRHRAYAEELRTQHRADVDVIARGAARGGHKAYAEELRTQFDASVDEIAHAAAWGGHRVYAEELRTQFGADIKAIIRGASGAYKTFLQHIIDQSELTETTGSIGPSPSSNVNGLFSTVHNHASITDYSGTIVISLPENQESLDQFEEEVGESYRCPITHCVFTQPVMASDGETYEYSAIKRHIEGQLSRGRQVSSPLTNQLLDNHNLIPNNDKARMLRDKLDAFLSKQNMKKAGNPYAQPDNNNAKKVRLV